MTRNFLLVLVLMVFITVNLFAIDMSLGFGGNFSLDSDIYWDGNVGSFRNRSDDTEHVMTIGGEIFIFFDAKFIEAGLGFMYGSAIGEYLDGREWSDSWDNGMPRIFTTFHLYGKYPFNLGRFTYFPLLGIQYDISIGDWGRSFVNSDGSDGHERVEHTNNNRLWVKIGAGADFNITNKVYLRPSILYGLNFGKNNDRDRKKENNNLGSVHDGFDFRLAIGFKL